MRRGFTLVEVVVVLFILGMVAAVTLPAFARLDGEGTVGTTASQLAGILRESRKDALRQGTVVEVAFIPESGRYHIRRMDAVEIRSDSGTLTLADDVRVVAAGRRVLFTFAPTGEAFGGPVVMRSPDRTVRVGVDRWTGDIRVERR